ncbi:hypothetical protein SAMN06266787_10812 [Halorubrum ezzemoulense]|uniref:Uncharacterized protein n=1 Tax=Halorubrum ezzemoulense TaxID=337243 RepID=A0A238Y349_HALEZ|nr:hypothetical protein [Halorubrum ezzemoulense]SNR65238.1 hypothetical protein SAMN06266787_10812 [Halorubrum ezzemoulense]
MSSELRFSEIYPRWQLWAIRLVGVFIVLSVVTVGVAIDARNPPLTDNGFIVGAFLGAGLGAGVVSWLLLTRAPTTVEIEAQDGECFGTAVAASFMFLLPWFVVYMLVGVVLRLLSVVSLVPYPGTDAILIVSSVIAACVTSAGAPEWSLSDEGEVSIERKAQPSRETPPFYTDSNSEQADDDLNTPSEQDRELEDLLESINFSRERSEELIQDGSFERASERIQVGLDACKKATDLSESRQLGRLDEIEFEYNRLKTLHAQARKNDDEPPDEEDQALQRAQELTKAAEEALDEHEFETAAGRASGAEALLEDVETSDTGDIDRSRAEIEKLRQRLRSKVREEVQALTSRAEEMYDQSVTHVDAGEYEQANASVVDSIEQTRQVRHLVQQHDIENPDSLEDIDTSLSSLQDRIESIKTTERETEEQQNAVRRAIQSGEYEHAEEALRHFREQISNLDEFDEVESTVSSFKSEARQLEQKLSTDRASQRVNGFLGAAGSSRSQAEQLLSENEYDRAIRRLESARNSLAEAERLNERHDLSRGDTIAEKKGTIQSLLESASSKPAEDLSTILQEAESEIASGIDARDANDVTAAVESFEAALSQYKDAAELATECDLDQQWEVEQRRSMVEEYLEVTQEALNNRQRTVRNELEQTLETAESVLTRVEQHMEVDDVVSARESLTEVRSHVDDAARLVETGLATERLEDRYTEVDQREAELREQLPDEQPDGYRTSDLVESLQVLATKLGEPPRPEFVNQYGDYPADAYLDVFGSWPEALAATNLDPIDEASRKRGIYSRVEVLNAVVELANELGHPPSKSEMNTHGAMSASPVQSRFTDWETALEVAGVTEEQLETSGDERGEEQPETGGEEPSEGQLETSDDDQDAVEDDSGDTDTGGILGEIEGEIKEFGAE